MIQVQFHRLKMNQIILFKITGHAESGPYGHDLVCAAVSALSIGAVNSLIELGAFDPLIQTNEEDGGFLLVKLPNELSKEQKHTAQILLESLFLSLTSVKKEYPEYIAIEEKRVESH